MNTTLILSVAAMVVLGHLVHLLKKVIERRKAGDEAGMIDIVRERPYRTLVGVLGSLAATALLIESGNVTLTEALAVGYMADSGLAVLEKRK